MPLITELPQKIQELDPQIKEIFERIFEIKEAEAYLGIPATMRAWVKENFGNVANVKKQRVVRIYNKMTGEGAIYNELRSKRPQIPKTEDRRLKTEDWLEEEIEKSRGDLFCDPLRMTPTDPFGRIKGKYCLTATNIAKFDGWHSLIIFKEHHPLRWNKEQIVDYLETAFRWFEKVKKQEGRRAKGQESLYPLFMWNCLWRAAASQIHGHAQVAVAKGRPYAQIENLIKAASRYRLKYQSDYFEDYFTVHQKLGLAFEKPGERVGEGLRILSPMVAKKDKEMQVWFPKGADASLLGKTIFDLLKIYSDELNVLSFNLALFLPPLDFEDASFYPLPTFLRLIDRGNLANRNSDIGIMEKFAQEVVESDPYRVIESLQQVFDRV